MGFTFLVPFVGETWRRVMLAISLLATLIMIAWLFRASDRMPSSRFWGLGVGACLSLALLAFTAVHDGV